MQTLSVNTQNWTPPINRNVESIDRKLFEKAVQVLAVRVPAKDTSKYTKGILKKFLLQKEKISNISVVPTEPDTRRILLGIESASELPSELLENLKEEHLELVDHVLTLEYSYWTADEILQAILPEELLDESPTSFTVIGHIAHLNLREAYLPYRYLIGRVILDKNKNIRTVVNKLDMIDNTYRNFAMEVLAGEQDFIVTSSESNCTFKFDFSKVYFNSRLENEHKYLVSTFEPTDLIVDAFAGVGPFAVPAGKKGCAVLAGDLNPDSWKALVGNIQDNKVANNVRTMGGPTDGGQLIKDSAKEIWDHPFEGYVVPLSTKEKNRRKRAGEALTVAPPGPSRRLPNHYVMNLPASALEFLGSYRHLYRNIIDVAGAKEAIDEADVIAGGQPGDGSGLPTVHCYCFSKEEPGPDAEKDVLQRAETALGMPIPKSELRYIRHVAPKKDMYCFEFKLTREMVL